MIKTTAQNASFSEGQDFRRIAGNVASMLTSSIAIRATSFVMYALVARYLGSYKLGQLALAMSLFFTFHRFALGGLGTLLTREVAKDKTKSNIYFVNASFVALITSALSFLGIVAFVRAMDYSPDTGYAIVLLFAGLLPYTLSQICEALFRAWEKMQYIAYVNIPVNMLQTIAAYVLLVRGYDIQHVVISVVVSYVAILLVEWVFILYFINGPKWRLDLNFSMSMLKASAPFLGIQGTYAIKSSINIILLSKLLGETEVGLYSAASQLLVPLLLIFNNVVNSIFPIMCRKFESGRQSLQRVAERLIELLLAIALPAVIGVFILAEGILTLLYQDPDFLRSATVLRILIWLPMQDALTTVLGQVLWASQQEKASLRIAVVNTLVKLVVGIALISRLGLMGAAFATVLVAVINVFQHYLPVSKLFSRLRVERLVWKPMAASLAMALYILLFNSLNLVVLILSAALVYGSVLSLFIIWSSGGPVQFKAKYQHLFF